MQSRHHELEFVLVIFTSSKSCTIKRPLCFTEFYEFRDLTNMYILRGGCADRYTSSEIREYVMEYTCWRYKVFVWHFSMLRHSKIIEWHVFSANMNVGIERNRAGIPHGTIVNFSAFDLTWNNASRWGCHPQWVNGGDRRYLFAVIVVRRCIAITILHENHIVNRVEPSLVF